MKHRRARKIAFALTTLVALCIVGECKANVHNLTQSDNDSTLDSVKKEKKEEENGKKDKVYLVAEQRALFPGGDQAMMKYLQKNITYPKQCLENKIGGRTLISFVVAKNGKLKDFKVFKSSGNKMLDKEALRVIKKMPRWQPAIDKGEPVAMQFTLPVSFKLRP